MYALIGAGVHDGLRRPPADQLRGMVVLHGRRACGVPLCCLPASTRPAVHWSGGFVLAVLIPILVGALVSGVIAVVCQGLVYRPLRGEGAQASLLAVAFSLLYVPLLWGTLAGHSRSLGCCWAHLGYGASSSG